MKNIIKSTILTSLVWVIESMLLFLICWGIGTLCGLSMAEAFVYVLGIGATVGLLYTFFCDEAKDWHEHLTFFLVGWLLAVPAIGMFGRGIELISGAQLEELSVSIVEGGLVLLFCVAYASTLVWRAFRYAMYPIWDRAYYVKLKPLTW